MIVIGHGHEWITCQLEALDTASWQRTSVQAHPPLPLGSMGLMHIYLHLSSKSSEIYRQIYLTLILWVQKEDFQGSVSY